MHFAIILESWYIYTMQLVSFLTPFPPPPSLSISSFPLVILVDIINLSACLWNTMSTFIEVIRTFELECPALPIFPSSSPSHLPLGPPDSCPSASYLSPYLILSFFYFLLVCMFPYSDNRYHSVFKFVYVIYFS